MRMTPPTITMLFVSLLSVAALGCGSFFSLGSGRSNSDGWNYIIDRGQQRLTPQWAPRGDRILFIYGGYWGGEIFVSESDGTSLLRLNLEDDKYEYLNSPDISPDGSRVAYTTGRFRELGSFRRGTADWDIETSGLDGSGRARLTDSPGEDTSPVWSPDGSRIAFVRDRVPSYVEDPMVRSGIYIMSADGSEARMLMSFREPNREVLSQFDKASLYHTLVWSPDGGMVAFQVDTMIPNPNPTPSSPMLDVERLYTIGVDGSGLTQMFQVGEWEKSSIYSGPAWSPDGGRIAFTVLDHNTFLPTLYTVSPDGSNLQELAVLLPSHVGTKSSLQWSPDGEQILYSWGYRPPRMRITPRSDPKVFVINADGSQPREVADGTYASWSPDGSRIAVVDDYDSDEGTPFLFTVAADGSDIRVLVRRTRVLVRKTEDGLQAENRSCFLWFCR